MHLHLIALWTSLAGSPHEQGTWHVEHRGQVYRGDWKVTSTEPAYNAGAHLASQHRWVHFASSTSSDYCAIAIEQPDVMYCRNARSCPEPWNCRPVQLPASAMRAAMRSAEPSLVIEQVLFARIHQRSIFAALNATGDLRNNRLRLTVPHREESKKTPLDLGFQRRVTMFETTFSIGPRPRDIGFTITREVDAFTEKCLYSERAMSSCMPQPPDCVRL